MIYVATQHNNIYIVIKQTSQKYVTRYRITLAWMPKPHFMSLLYNTKNGIISVCLLN